MLADALSLFFARSLAVFLDTLFTKLPDALSLSLFTDNLVLYESSSRVSDGK